MVYVDKNRNSFFSKSRNTLRFQTNLNLLPSVLSVGYLRNINIFNIETKVGILYMPIENIYGKLREDIDGFDSILDLIEKFKDIEKYKETIESVGNIVDEIDINQYSSLISNIQDLDLNDLEDLIKAVTNLNDPEFNFSIGEITIENAATEIPKKINELREIENKIGEYISNIEDIKNKFSNIDSIIDDYKGTFDDFANQFEEIKVDFNDFKGKINEKIDEVTDIIDEFNTNFQGVLNFVSNNFENPEDIVRYFFNFDRRSIGFINITNLPQFRILKSIKFDNELHISTYNNFLVGRIFEVKIINYLKLINIFKNNFNLALTINNSAVYIQNPVEDENTFYSNNFSYYPAFGVDISLLKTFLLSAKYVLTNKTVAIDELKDITSDISNELNISNNFNVSNIELNFSLLF